MGRKLIAIFFTFLSLATGLILAGGVQAVTVHVPGEYATIQEAVNAASNGDRILVQGKAYTETVNFKGKTLTVCSVRSEREINCFTSPPELTGNIELVINQDTSHLKPLVVNVSTPREFAGQIKNPPAKPSGNTLKLLPPPEYLAKLVKSQNTPEMPRQFTIDTAWLPPNQDKLPLDSAGVDKSTPDFPEARLTGQFNQPNYAKLDSHETKSIFKGNDDYLVKSGNFVAGKNTVMQAKKGVSIDEFEQYKQLVRLKVEANREYPLQARRENLQGVVTVRFLVQKDGQLRDVQVVDSSSFNILDQAALQAVARSAPFLPLPNNVSQDNIWFKVPIVFKMQASGFRMGY